MKQLSLPFTALAALTLFGAGCASTHHHDKAGQTSTSLQETAVGIDKGGVQIDAVLAALSDLVNNPGGDMKSRFEKFESAQAKLESLAKKLGSQAVEMQEKGAAYFQQWDADLARIQSEDIRSRSTDRRNAVAARFDRVRASYAHANLAFVPFMSRLADVRTVLSSDLTSEGVASIKSFADQANTEAVPLREALRELSDDFKSLGVSLSSTN